MRGQLQGIDARLCAVGERSRNALNAAVHNAAAVLSAEQFHRLVEHGPQPGRDMVVFVTGIPGAGKSGCD